MKIEFSNSRCSKANVNLPITKSFKYLGLFLQKDGEFYKDVLYTSRMVETKESVKCSL